MGRELIQAIQLHGPERGVQLSAALVRDDHPLLGVDAGRAMGLEQCDVQISSDLNKCDFDVLIDFTSVDNSLANLKVCLERSKAMVIGTTGFSEVQQEQIQQAGEKLAIVLAANMSVGMNLCFHLLENMTKVLAEDSDIEIIETHHRHKVDSPSGTALKLGEIIAKSSGRNLQRDAVYGRHGIDEPRKRETIGFSTVRGGDVVGDHTVLFASDGERIELTHKASSRMTFATGAVRAAAWLADKPPGFFDMQDVLGFKDN